MCAIAARTPPIHPSHHRFPKPIRHLAPPRAACVMKKPLQLSKVFWAFPQAEMTSSLPLPAPPCKRQFVLKPQNGWQMVGISARRLPPVFLISSK